MGRPTQTTHNPLAPPAVVGLDASRHLAGRRHRRQRLKERISSSAAIVVVTGVVVAAGYVGYTIYTEGREAEQVERQQRLAEIQAERQGRTTDDLIDQLEDQPRWNGPGAPAFGVEREDPTAIEITDGNIGG